MFRASVLFILVVLAGGCVSQVRVEKPEPPTQAAPSRETCPAPADWVWDYRRGHYVCQLPKTIIVPASPGYSSFYLQYGGRGYGSFLQYQQGYPGGCMPGYLPRPGGGCFR